VSAQLNHTILWCRDQAKSAGFLAQILGLPEPRRFMHFLVVDLANNVSVDYFETTDPVALQHLAFLVTEEEFDAVLARIRQRVPQVWAIRHARSPARSTITSAGAACTSRILTAICLRSSRGPTAAKRDDQASAALRQASTIAQPPGQSPSPLSALMCPSGPS